MHEVVIIGAGGHAKVIIDILKSGTLYRPMACTDSAPKMKEILGVQVLGDDNCLPRLRAEGLAHAFVAVGCNSKRESLARMAEQMGFELINAVSPYACLSSSAVLGRGVAVMPGAVINADSVIGDNAIINTGATIDHDCVIGSCCHIAPGCHIAGRVQIGEGSFIGIGCSILPDLTVGSWTVVGAGAVVTRNLPDRVMAAGVPAQVRKELQDTRQL